MSLLETIFDAGARRRKKHADLVEARAALQDAYAAAIASGADIDKPQAALAKHDAAIAAAQAAIDATEAAAERQRLASRAVSREQAEQIAVTALADFAREVASAEEMALAAAAQWIVASDALSVAHGAERRAIELGSEQRTVSGRGVSMHQLFTRVYMRALRVVHDGTGKLLMYPSTTGQYQHESAADALARELASHATFTKELSQ